MDVDVESLTDAELRSKLIEFGYPVMPITGTTRKIMMKKLKVLLEGKKGAARDGGRRSLGRYSSEEESDSDSRPLRKDKLRRATMGAPTMQPPVRRKPPKEPEPEPSPPVKKEVKTVTTTTRTLKILQGAKDEFDTGSESDEVADKYDEPYRKETSFSDKSANFSDKTPTKLPSSFVSASLAAEAASEKLSQIRSRYSSYSPTYSTYSSDDVLKDKENTPFLSNFTKRLSQLSESPKSNLYDYKSDIIKENDVNGGTSTRNYLNSFRSVRGRLNSYDYKPTAQSIFKNNFVPFMVLVVATLFFVVVAVVYLGLRSSTSLEVSAKIPICSKIDPNSRRYVNCVVEGEGKQALNLLQVLSPELQKRALRNKCEDSNVKPYMTETEVVAFIVNNYAIKEENRIINDLHNLEVLTFFNSDWGVRVLQLNENDLEFTESALAKNMEEVLEGRRTKHTALIYPHPYIPWSCYIYNTFKSLFSVILSLLIASLILFLLTYLYKFYTKIRAKQQDEEFTLVENIIDVLQTHAGDSEDAWMVISHVRDMIIPINERRNKQKAWLRAVNYVHENESRIRTEQRRVQGEVTEVWRWLGGPTANLSKNKSWQGQAFETQIGSVNSLPCSPTPCLKIRGMVEEGDRNTVMIKKAVLSKCAQQCRILHCAVDLNSKCVYLKCADQNEAAVAYRNLHGWWYAGNLVTVKYLRLERYMQRFPDSPASGPPFLQ